MGLMKCPNCNRNIIVGFDNSDYVHKCNSGNTTLDEKDVVVMGGYYEETKTVTDYIGAEAIDRPNTVGGDYTQIMMEESSPHDGFIKEISLYTTGTVYNIKAGSFYRTSDLKWKARDSVVVGTVTGSGLHTVSGLYLQIKKGDYLGFYFDLGVSGIARDNTGGKGVYYKTNSFDVGVEYDYVFSAGRTISFRGMMLTSGQEEFVERGAQKVMMQGSNVIKEEGEKVERETRRGNNPNVVRQRQKYQYINIKKDGLD